MLNALSQSPITANQFFDWNNKLHNDEILVREIIDIDTNYMEDDENNNESKSKKQDEEQNQEENNNADDEFNPTLAAMEIKPKVLQTVHNLTKDYNKLIKYQKKN